MLTILILLSADLARVSRSAATHTPATRQGNHPVRILTLDDDERLVAVHHDTHRSSRASRHPPLD